MITVNTNKILIPIDFSKTSIRAIQHAVAIAKVTKGQLLVLHVQKKNSTLVDIILPALKLKDTKLIEEFLDDKLQQLVKSVSDEYGVAITPLVSSGNITSEIVNRAEEHKVGLIVMGTQGSDSSNNNLFFGSNAYRVLTKAITPVMTVRSDAPKLGYSNILLPIDSSEHSRQKVNYAIQIAEKFGAHLHVLGLLGTHEPNYEYKLNVILPQIKKMAEKRRVECSAKIEQAVNRAEKTLTYAKKIKADLIIIMTDQSAEFSSVILGTYAHQVIDNSKIPVLSIPPEIHSENIGQDSLGGLW